MSGESAMFRYRLKSIALAAVFSIIAFSTASAQWDLYLQGSLVTGGDPHDLVAVDDYILLGDWDAGLAVIDISDPWSPAGVFDFDTQGLANSVFVSGNLAFLADWSYGVSIFDITDPQAPVFMSIWDSPGVTYNVYATGNYVYMADFNSGLVVLDITDPFDPVHVTTIPTPGLATGIWGTGDYVYLADFPDGILTFDISDPESPQLVDTYVSAGAAINISGSGDLLFLSDGGGGVKILSIAQPSEPIFVTAIGTTGYVNDVSVSDTLMYIAEDSAGVSVYSISDYWSPYWIASYNTPGAAKGAFARGRTVFVGDRDSFLVLLLNDSPVGIDEDPELLPELFSLNGVYPNPFNPETIVEFSLADRVDVKLQVYDLLGRSVDIIVNEELEPGTYRVRWSGDGFPSGVYFFSLSGGGVTQTVRATLLK
jgi:hypothetical protein